MPDLKNCFFYNDWILDLDPVKALRWHHNHIYHQCKLGIINSSWVHKDVTADREDQWGYVCKGCGAVTSDNEARVLKATKALLRDPVRG